MPDIAYKCRGPVCHCDCKSNKNIWKQKNYGNKLPFKEIWIQVCCRYIKYINVHIQIHIILMNFWLFSVFFCMNIIMFGISRIPAIRRKCLNTYIPFMLAELPLELQKEGGLSDIIVCFMGNGQKNDWCVQARLRGSTACLSEKHQATRPSLLPAELES